MKTLHKIALFALLLACWLYWDFSQAEKSRWSPYKSHKPLSSFGAKYSEPATVAIVRSDDPQLAHPIPVDDAAIGFAEIEGIVRRAVALAGSFDHLVKSGDIVLLKPNIVDPEPPGSGEVTDVRVIKALIKMIDEIDHGKIEIVVGEGAPRPMDYEMKYQSRFASPSWNELWDAAGYQDLLADPYLNGINLRLSNLNGSPPENPWQNLVEVEVPGGGEASPQAGKYFIHRDIVNANVFITVPVMKIHDPGITVALKNQIGLAPSTMYGFSKTAGVPQDGYRHSLVHGGEAPKWWTDKEIVDLCRLARIKFAVVDALACLETEKNARRSGGVITNLVRMNTIVAGADPVAVDHVCARLMGLNPDDVEHITLAEKTGLGTNDPSLIQVVGATLEQTQRRFKKSSSPSGDYGQSNRVWLMNGPYATTGITDPMDHLFLENEAGLRPQAGQSGWSDPVYFTDDRIDLRDYFNLSGSDEAVGYAFTYFDAPRDQRAELWLGSDEALRIYLNGEVVYAFNSSRSFSDNSFYSLKVPAQVKSGENTLLVKSLQKFGRYDFSLNICEPESDPVYDGNRIWGLKFKTASGITAVEQDEIVKSSGFELQNVYPNPFNPSTTIVFELPKAGHVRIVICNSLGQRVATLLNENTNAGVHQVSFNGANLSSGLYFCRMESGEFTQVRKLMLVK